MGGRGERRRRWSRRKYSALCALAGLALALGESSRLGRADAQAAPGPVIFQPAFHQALRWSQSSSRMTYRVKVPLGRGGNRVRVSFRAGDGSLHLYAATFALAGARGALASDPVALTFGGSPSFEASPRQRVTSDPVAFPVSAGAEVAVSFEVEGELAASAINVFPDSYATDGSHATDKGAPGGSLFNRAVGLDGVDVEGPPGRAFVAIGDSITEGYIFGNDDYRQNWSVVAQGLLQQPIVDAAVSGQGIYEECINLPAEVLPLQGITDCVVLLGTNDLAALDPKEETSRLGGLFDQLRPFCRLWVGTLLPKERDSRGDLTEVNRRRQIVNDWIRTQALVAGVIDFEAAVRRPDDPNRFQDGLAYDGIHPSIAGQRRLGEEAARALTQQPILSLTGIAPGAGAIAGGTAVTLSGTGFKPTVSVTFGGVPAAAVSVASPTALIATAPRHAAGSVDVVAKLPDGQGATLTGGYTYGAVSLVTGASPATGTVDGGTRITVMGTGFLPGMSVSLGGVAASDVRVISATSIVVTAPPHEEGAVDVVARNPDGLSAVLQGGYTYVPDTPQPKIDKIAPAPGPASGGPVVGQPGSARAGHGCSAAPLSLDLLLCAAALGLLRRSCRRHR